MAFNTGSEIKRGPSFTPAQFAIAAVLLTALVLFGIKVFLGGANSGGNGEPAAGPVNPFKDTSPAPASGYNPAARSEAMPSAGSVDLFAKTNAGYAGEDAEQAASTAAARAADELDSPAGAALKSQAGKNGLPAKVQAPALRRSSTAIPRLQPVKTFGSGASVGSGKMPSRAGGGANADISAIVNGAMRDAEKKSGGGR